MGTVLLSHDERNALLGAVSELDQNGLDALVYTALGKRVAEFGSINDNMIVLSVKFSSWITERPDDLHRVIGQICTNSPSLVQIGILKTLQARLQAAAMINPPQSFEAVLIDTAAVANRAPLRDTLRQLAALNATRPIVVVSGGEQSGRSHSWHLIKHVARDYRIGVKRIDLEQWVPEQRTLDAVFSELVSALEISDTDGPTSEGVTKETLGQKYADWVRKRHEQTDTTKRHWIVFDSTDRAMAHEIAAFLQRLCELRLDADLEGCTFFFLGDGTQLNFDENNPLLLKERLSRILPYELEEAAHSINAIGAKPMTAAELADWANSKNQQLAACNDRECGKSVSQVLNALRLAVQAP